MAESLYPLWKTREGVEIRIEDMTDSHLANAIAMIERATPARARHLVATVYMRGPGPSGDMAQMAFDEEVQMLLSPDVHPSCVSASYEHLVAEQKRRGIDAPSFEERIRIHRRFEQEKRRSLNTLKGDELHSDWYWGSDD